MTNLTNVESNQLSVFNYGDIAKKYNQETADQLKSLEYEGTGILVNAKVEFGNVLRKGKALVDYRDFNKWYSTVWGIPQQRVSDLMKIAEAHEMSPETGEIFPDKLRSASTMAKAILGVDEEKRNELVGDLKKQKDIKGKDLTEAEIKELAKKYLDEKDNEIASLKQTEIELTAQLAVKQVELQTLNSTVENQNKQIKELNSDISAKEQKLKSLKEKEEELKTKEQNIQTLIKEKSNEKLEELKKPELEKIQQQQEDLANQQKQLKQELRKQKELAEALENQKKKFNEVRDWLKRIEDFNKSLKTHSMNIVSTIKDVQNLPLFEELADDQRKVLFPRFSSAMNEFEKNSETWGKAINQIYSALSRADKEVVNLINQPIDVEVNHD